jgi:hypothetical protein
LRLYGKDVDRREGEAGEASSGRARLGSTALTILGKVAPILVVTFLPCGASYE